MILIYITLIVIIQLWVIHDVVEDFNNGDEIIPMKNKDDELEQHQSFNKRKITTRSVNLRE